MEHSCAIQHALRDNNFCNSRRLHATMFFVAFMGTNVDELDCFGNGMTKAVLVTGAIRDKCVENELLDIVRYVALYLGCIPVVGQAFGVYPCSMRLTIRGGCTAVDDFLG